LAVHRVQNPGTGRWTSPDPWGFAGAGSNLERYCSNDPTGYYDSTGLSLAKPQRPSGDDLVNMPQIQTWMRDLLKRSQEGQPTEVHEEGAWIYWNPKNGRIHVLKNKPEKVVTKGKGRAHIFFGKKPFVLGCTLIGMIHTHPDPDEGGFFPDPARSPDDMANQPKYGVPWIVPTRKHGVYILENGGSTNTPWTPNPSPKGGNTPPPAFTPKAR
jgi:hypothetical protein